MWIYKIIWYWSMVTEFKFLHSNSEWLLPKIGGPSLVVLIINIF